MVSGMGALSSSDVLLDGVVRQGWWLVADEDDGPSRIVAGPFLDRAEAGWAAGAEEHDGVEDVRPDYGIRRADGTLNRRPSPQDWAWLAHLSEQLERLPDDWDAELADDDPLRTPGVEGTRAPAAGGAP